MNPLVLFRRLLPLRAARIALAGLVLYAIGGFFVLPALVKAQVPKRLSVLLHRQVSLARVRANPFTLSLTLDGFRVKDKDGSLLLGWERLYLNLGAQSLFRRAPVFQEIRLVGFQAHVVLDKQGNPSFADLMVESPKPTTASTPPEVRIQRLVVTGARVDVLDQATSQPFATVLGPLSLELDAFRLSRDSRNPYAFSGRTERGETFAWQGHFLLDPLRSQGTFQVGQVFLPKYAPFYRDSVAFEMLGGTLDFKASYDFRWGEGDHAFSLHGGELALDNLALGEAGQRTAVVELPQLRLLGLEADLLASRARVASLTLRNGRIQVRRDGDGTLNLQRMAVSPGPPQPPPARPFRFELDELRVENQVVRIQDRVPARPVDLDLDNLALRVKHLSLDPASLCDVDLDLRWNGRGHVHAAGRLAPLESRGALDVKVEDLDLPPLTGYLDPALETRIAAGRLGVAGHVDFDGPASRYRFQGQAQVRAFKAEKGPGREVLLGWDALRLGGIRVATGPLALSLASIDLEGPALRVVVTGPGAGTPAPRLAMAGTPAPQPVKAGTAPPLKAELGGLTIKGGSFTLLDRTVQPVAALSLDAIQGQVGRLSTDPAARASLEFHARVDGAAPLTAKGTVNLLSQAAYSDVVFTLGGMDLSPLSPYAGRFLGYGIEKGKLEVDLRYLVQDTRLRGENHLRMDQFTLGESVPSPDAVHLPVKLGLALLRDRHGVIDLDVPVRGDLAQPDFRLGRAIWHAVLNVFAKIATSPFALLGKAFGGGDADLSLLAFQPGSAALDPQGLQVLATLEKGLYERPGLRLDMEGTVDEAQDGPALRRAELEAQLARLKGQPLEPGERPKFLKALFREAFPPADAKAPEPVPEAMEARLLATLPVDAAALKLLARSRVGAVREQLLKGGRVEEGRLFVVEGSERAKKEGGCRVFFELK